MNARIDYETSFLAAVYWEDQVLFNSYHITLKMRTMSMDSSEHNIALDRIRYIVNEMVTNAVFIHDEDRASIKKLEAAGIKVINLPEIPVDQIVGMMLFSKITAAMEDHMEIGQLSISSLLGENIVYHQDSTESVGPFEDNGWWQDPEPRAQGSKSGVGKVVRLQKSQTWRDLDLHWANEEDDDNEEDSENNTVVAFRKDDKE
jgi:hypothetical protein